MACLNISSTLVYNGTLRVGYRIKATSSPFTYIPAYLVAADFPYAICGLTVGAYEVELTQICPNCAGGVYADPVIQDAIVV